MADYNNFNNNFNNEFNEFRSEAQEAIRDVRQEAGEVFQEARSYATGQPLYTANQVGGAGYRAPEQQSSGKAVASLVLGILSILSWVIGLFTGFFSIFGFIFGLIGTILGAKARKECQTGTATAGFVCSLIGLILSCIGLICAIACVGALGTAGLLAS